MPVEDYLLFRAYDLESPISDHRGDLLAAQVAASVFQVKGAKVTVGDMVPDWSGKRAAAEAARRHEEGQSALLAHLLAFADPAPAPSTP